MRQSKYIDQELAHWERTKKGSALKTMAEVSIRLPLQYRLSKRIDISAKTTLVFPIDAFIPNKQIKMAHMEASTMLTRLHCWFYETWYLSVCT